ncbi:MAG: purine/pyrimidine permease, partial [Candidatus Eremiobacteraeota bacterium]|nr:purine/pyrimidine permease [Candidatus Eremiobacteraeota bacterium]
TSGLTTLLQVHKLGPLGSGLLSVTGPSFAFVPLAITTGAGGDLGMDFGLALAGAWVPMLVAFSLKAARRLFPPLVTGIAITLIGVTLIGVGFSQISGFPGTPGFGSPLNFGLGFLVVAFIVAGQAWGQGWLRNTSIALGLLVGTLVAAAAGRVDFSPVSQAAAFELPYPLRYGLHFNPVFLVPWLVAYLLVALECIGDLTATSGVSREPVEGPLFESRLRGGLLADGVGCIFCSLFCALPKTTFAQNNGIIALTGVASRRVGIATGVMLAICGLLPQLAALISVIPKPVLGGATFLMFSTVAAAGLQIAGRGGLSGRNQFILACSLGLGIGVQGSPAALEALRTGLLDLGVPAGLGEALKVLLESGMAMGTLAAAALNLILPANDEENEIGAHE